MGRQDDGGAPKEMRDEFSAKTKNVLALRASYLCSLCKCATVGPSGEGPSAVMVIGVAAHICAAAPGPGARRYDPTMTSGERSHINNGIWLCASCSVSVDRDEVSFPVDRLKSIKLAHERERRLNERTVQRHTGYIIAIGDEITAVGEVISATTNAARYVHPTPMAPLGRGSSPAAMPSRAMRCTARR